MTIDVERSAPKPPPEKPEAEASLIGSILIDAHIYEETVRGRIAPAELSRESHRLVLAAIERVWERGEPLGFQSVQSDLAARGELDAVGGAQFLVGLMQNVPTVAHAETYATIVERTALLRRLIGAANEIAHLALTREDARSAVEDAQELLFAVSESNLHRDVVPLELALRRFADQITARADDHHEGVPTGFASLDAKTGGLQPNDLILLAGRPGLGKTSFALNIVWNAAAVERKTCAVFSLEMSEMQVVQRLISMTSEIDGNRMRRGRLSPEEFRSISAASDQLQKAPIFVEESSQLTVTDILAKARRLQAERGLDLLVIDYLQLIEGAGDDEGRVLEVARISRGLKAIARELQVPVIALSQLSRQIETRGTEPMLSDLRECVTGDTRVIDANTGRWVAVRDVKKNASVVGLGRRQHTEVFEVADAWSTGVKPVYRLTSQSGLVIRATANHPFLTPQGWKPLAMLTSHDLIASAMRLPEHGTERRERADLCRLLGYLAGDGTYQKWRAVGFISNERETFDDCAAIVTRSFPGVTPRMKRHPEGYLEADFSRVYENGYGRPHGNPLREWLRDIGVHGQSDELKRVPDFVFDAGAVGAAQFLAGYLASDGCVKSRVPSGKRRRWSIQFDTVSHALATDVQALLLRIGVNSTVRPGAWNTKSTQPIYRIEVNQSAPNLARFAQLVPVRGRKAALLRALLEDRPARETSPGIYALPYELSAHLTSLRVGWKDQHKRMRRSTALRWAERTGDDALRAHAESDVLWERIRSIEPAGAEEVFDLRLPASGNFIANGLVVHNSGALEADADLVMFLWQKDRKDRDENVVRLKLAKHRNGPTGDFDLHFQSELTRFRDLGETRVEA